MGCILELCRGFQYPTAVIQAFRPTNSFQLTCKKMKQSNDFDRIKTVKIGNGGVAGIFDLVELN